MKPLIDSALLAIKAGDIGKVETLLITMQERLTTDTNASPNAKRCPKCSSTCLALFTSLRYKHCNDCGHKWSWELAPKQKPLF